MAEFKAFVATVAETAKQKKLSEGIQLDAVEMVRCSEHALGQTIREGQSRGEISDRDSGSRVSALLREANKRGEQLDDENISLPKCQTEPPGRA